MTMIAASALGALLFTGCADELGHGKTGLAGLQEKQEKQDKQNAKARVRRLVYATLEKEGIKLDLKAKTVTIPVVVNAPTNELEFLLIHPIGKKHEALLLSKCKPSIIRAAFEVLDLKPGKNASFVPKKPPPTQAQLEAGVNPMILVPPSGTPMYMTVSYDKDGKQITKAIEELLHDWEANHSMTDNKWIYLGGRMAQLYRHEPKVFMADFEGNLISTCYRHPHNHLFTIVHERARDDMNWSPSNACPDPGTEMKLTFHVAKPPAVAAYEGRMKVEIALRKKADKAKRKERNPARRGQEPPRKDPPKKGAKGEKKK